MKGPPPLLVRAIEVAAGRVARKNSGPQEHYKHTV